MDKKNKLILIIIAVCTLVVVGICGWAIRNHEKEIQKIEKSDALKFKEEYESLNGKATSNNSTYPTVTIDENNTVKYVTETEAVELLENGTGIIYFGFKECPWCRNMISTLTNVAKENATKVYYLDILDLRSKIELKEVNEKMEIQVTKKGTDSYYKILNILDKDLTDYELVDEKGKKYNTGEKRLYAPTVVSFDEGSIEEVHVGTVESQEDPYVKLTEDEEKELNKIFTKIVKSVKKDSCTSASC